jgi:hypothetical protein
VETTEKIVESYCRYVKQWFTIPNIKCQKQFEVDLLAVDTTTPKRLNRYHIECGVSISTAFSKLTAKEFSAAQLKQRVQAPAQRRTLGFFIERSSMFQKSTLNSRSMDLSGTTTIVSL